MTSINRRSLFTLMAASTMSLSMAPAKAAEFVNILTGGTSGVYYPLGVGLSKIYGEKIPASHPGPGDQGFGRKPQSAAAGQGRNRLHAGRFPRLPGTAMRKPASRQPLDKLRGIAADLSQLHPDCRLEGIRHHRRSPDLKGKRLSVGAAKSGTELNARAILAAAGMSYDDLGKTEYLPFAESVELMKNRQLDATLQSAGLGVASIQDLATSVAVRSWRCPPDVVEKLGAPYHRCDHSGRHL